MRNISVNRLEEGEPYEEIMENKIENNFHSSMLSWNLLKCVERCEMLVRLLDLKAIEKMELFHLTLNSNEQISRDLIQNIFSMKQAFDKFSWKSLATNIFNRFNYQHLSFRVNSCFNPIIG